jgi:hypothetical protein
VLQVNNYQASNLGKNACGAISGPQIAKIPPKVSSDLFTPFL